MNRTIWFLAGAGAGVYAVVRARRAAEAFTPEGFRDRLVALELGAHLFGEEVRAGMAEKETELRRRLGAALDEPPELAAVPAVPGPHADTHPDTHADPHADSHADSHADRELEH